MPTEAPSAGTTRVEPASSVIQLDCVSKTYARDGVPVEALRKVDLRVATGEYVAVMGPSGSGKSTLLHVLGLLDDEYEGEYRFLDRLTSGRTSEELSSLRNLEIGFVFQTFHLLPHLSILENVELPALYAGALPAAECRARARVHLEQLGLGQRLDHAPNAVSIGQRQRAAIARALVNEPSLILADEPTGALDSKTVREILEVFDELHRGGATIVVITHDPEVAEAAGRTVYLRDGQLIEGAR